MTVEAFKVAVGKAYNLRGGLLAWVDAGHPLEPTNGTAGMGIVP